MKRLRQYNWKKVEIATPVIADRPFDVWISSIKDIMDLTFSVQVASVNIAVQYFVCELIESLTCARKGDEGNSLDEAAVAQAVLPMFDTEIIEYFE
jgi:hypothetical protein